jgi:hypothetical protein
VPALSQSLEFTVNGTTTTSVVYPPTTTTAQTFISTPIKAANYYGINNALQTVVFKLTDFVGTVTLQASLATQPAENDWFSVNLLSNKYSVDTTGLATQTPKSSISSNLGISTTEIYNFEGNYLWLRGRITAFTAGTVNGITINY